MDTDSGGSSPVSEEGDINDSGKEECCMDSLATWGLVNTTSAASDKDDLMIIRGTETEETEDIDQVKGHHLCFTSALAEQFDKDLSLSSDCNGAESDKTEEEEEDESSERPPSSSDPEFEQNEVAHDQHAGGDQCVAMETEATKSAQTKDEFVGMDEEQDGEAVCKEGKIHSNQLGGSGDCTEVKDTDVEADYTNLDFSLVEKTNSELNISASKQRVVLRKKGSLAKRRKPSRISIRASYCSPNSSMYIDSTDPPKVSNDTSELSPPPDGTAPIAAHLSDAHVNGDKCELSTTATVPSPVLLPGLTEASRLQLRGKPSVPLPHPHATSMTDGSGPTNSASPWLSEVLRPPRGEGEKLKSELEKPSWMKNALARRKRRSEIFMLHEESSNQTEKEVDMSASHWSKDPVVFRPKCPTLTKVTHSDSDINNTGNDVTDASELPKTNGSLHQMKAQRETLTPIRKRSTDGALVPSELAKLAPDFIVGSSEDRPSRNTLPPLRRVSIPPIVTDINDHADRWGSDAVPLRMKTRAHIQPLNTEHQVATGFVPPWKQELLEKKRKRESLPPPPVDRTKEFSGASDLPPWKQELEQRRKTIVGACPRVLEPIERDAEEIPEWAKSVQTRRARLANCGLIQSEEEEVIEEPRTS